MLAHGCEQLRHPREDRFQFCIAYNYIRKFKKTAVSAVCAFHSRTLCCFQFLMYLRHDSCPWQQSVLSSICWMPFLTTHRPAFINEPQGPYNRHYKWAHRFRVWASDKAKGFLSCHKVSSIWSCRWWYVYLRATHTRLASPFHYNGFLTYFCNTVLLRTSHRTNRVLSFRMWTLMTGLG